jgi:hypothetical protein
MNHLQQVIQMPGLFRKKGNMPVLRITMGFLRNGFIVLLFTLCVTAANAQNIGGIGAQLLLDSTGDYTMPKIQGLIPGSPAAKDLHEGWYILKVNDVSCKNKTLGEVVNLIRGTEGTTVKIAAADNKAGKHQKEYEMVRALVAVPHPAPLDPLAAFRDACENEVKQFGERVIKTFNSDCGDYFFNFNADPRTYHIRLLTMEEKGKGAFSPAFHATARVFDNDNEKESVELAGQEPKDYGGIMVAQSEAAVSFKRECVATINTHIPGDVKKCRAMYIIVYR